MRAATYKSAQIVIAEPKGAIHQVLEENSNNGFTNAELGRALGIYSGHVGHEGHISRTLLGMMESEGVVRQDSATKRWFLV
ncbi:MAG: hypothetical protein NUV80_05545 [Candidatus Berkelbacteria bacterium]|nr:hypothetical protein [Candidatus Berkelbacteria bacterium]